MQKILIIEDDQSQLTLVKEILKRKGYVSFAARSGETGLSFIGDELPDLILCDITLPGIDGYKILNTIRNNPKTAAIPFIFITAKSERQEFRKGMELGADDYLIKPFTEDELINSVNSRLKLESVRNKKRLNVIEKLSESDVEENGINKILIHVDSEPKVIKIDDLICISAVGDYSSVVVNDGTKHVIKKTMKWWEKKLPEKLFCRIHRSTIINLNFINKIEKWLNKAYRVYLVNVSKPFIISRRYGSKFKARLSN